VVGRGARDTRGELRDMALMGGVASVDITPRSGYGWRASRADKTLRGRARPLRSKALVLDDGTTRVCIITNDFIGVSADQCAQLRAGIEAATGIPAEMC